MFNNKANNYLISIIAYVDDLILPSNNLTEINRINYIMNSTFSLRDIDNLKYFLDFEVSIFHHGISLC